MTREQEAAAQTAFRRALLAGGYVPLANKDKQCVLPGWPGLAVDEAMIDGWAGAWRWRATGVRLDRGLVMIDLDVNDAAMIEAIIDALPEDLWTVFERCPVRLGGGAKEAWFARCARPFTRWASPAFWKPEDVPTDGDDRAPMQRVEVFGGASSRQAGVYGAHTVGADDKVKVAYRWRDGRGLVEVPFEALPVVTEAQVEALCKVAGEVMTRAGWTRVTSVAAGLASAAEVFDLTDEMEFETVDGVMTLAELTKAVGAGHVRLSASWLEGPSARRLDRCIASARHDGGLQILETANFQLHRPEKDGAYRPAGDALDRLRALGAEAGPGVFGGGDGGGAGGGDGGAGGGDDDADPVVLRAAELVASYGYCAEDRQAPVYRLDGGERLSMANFREREARWTCEIGKGRSRKTVTAVDMWSTSEDRLQLGLDVYDPRLPSGVAAGADGVLRRNTYRAPDEAHRAALAGARSKDTARLAEAWRRFMAHLVPGEDERAWLLNWLACKVQHPALRGTAVLLASAAYGTGRSSLLRLMAQVVGRGNARSVDPETRLLGSGGQSQYNDFMEGAVLLTVDEFLARGAHEGMHSQRERLYEKMKLLVDVRAGALDIVRKYQDTRTVPVFVSWLIASNHPRALPLPRDDRRFAVLAGGVDKLLDRGDLDEFVQRLDADDPLLAAVVWQELAGMACDVALLRAPPETQARADLIEASASDFELLVQDVLDAVPGDFVEMATLRGRVKRRCDEEGLVINALDTRLSSLLRDAQCPLGWEFTPTLYRVGGSRKRFVARAGARASLAALPPAEREDRLAGGWPSHLRVVP